MKKSYLFLVILLCLNIAYANEKGNGGGGVKKNGVYKTFYSAGVYINPEEMEEIPGADLYTETVTSLATEDGNVSRLLSSALPINGRKFYEITESDMSETVMESLIEEYAKVVKQPVKSLTIFAITDTDSKVTYLLPSYFNLSEIEQAAILFHEAYWILNPKADYLEVITAEMAFQKFLEAKKKNDYDLELPRILAKLFNSHTFAIKSAFKADLLIYKNGMIEPGKIFPENTCKFADAYESKITNTMLCMLGHASLPDVLKLQKKNPKSFFMKELVRYISNGFIISFHSEAMNMRWDNRESAIAALLRKKVHPSSIMLN